MTVKAVYRVQCAGGCSRYLSDVDSATGATYWTVRASSALAFYGQQVAIQADTMALKDGLCPRCTTRKQKEQTK